MQIIGDKIKKLLPMEVNYAGYRDYYMNRKTLSGCNPESNQPGSTVHELFSGLTTKIHLIAVILDETEEAKVQAIVSQ